MLEGVAMEREHSHQRGDGTTILACRVAAGTEWF
jgi:hypothetical protein